MSKYLGYSLPVEHLKIGECIFTNKPVIISTVLGSCVSATFFSTEYKLGAMFHAMLPDSSRAKGDSRRCNYVDSAITEILDRFEALDISPASLKVAMFGGAMSLRNSMGKSLVNMLNVGRKNVDMCREVLEGRRVPILVDHTLGRFGRKVLFNTCTGQVSWRYVGVKDDHPFKHATPGLGGDCRAPREPVKDSGPRRGDGEDSTEPDTPPFPGVFDTAGATPVPAR